MLTPTFGIFGFIPLIVVLAIFLPPIVRILRRTGHSGWWCLLAFIPLLNLIGLWIFAYARWPAVDKIPN